jgi:hypothetical protein
MRQDWTPQQTADFIRDLRTYDKDWARIWHTHGDKRTDGLPSLYPVRRCLWLDAVAICPVHFYLCACAEVPLVSAQACHSMQHRVCREAPDVCSHGAQLLLALLMCCCNAACEGA